MPLSVDRALERSLTWARALRRRTAGWSPVADREFHDSLFSAPAHDPFSATYPGNVTIRRFADRADPYVRGAGSIVDLGCGPGEITCELARRHPSTRFHGVDHSAVAVEQARKNAARVGAANVTFETADVSAYTLPAGTDLVTMFDAFHHLVDPAGFVKSLSAHAERFLLIEPAGDRLGRWRRAADFDWIATELDKIRLRIEHELGMAAPAVPATPQPAPSSEGRAVENRYPMTDYEAFFRGYEVEFAGTVAGLDVYPTAPDSGSEFRAAAMETAYRLLEAIDRQLADRGADLYAKHWVIHASRGGSPTPLRRSPGQATKRRQTFAVTEVDQPNVQGPWDARYSDASVPADMAAGAEVLIEITIHNESWRVWDSHAAKQPVKLSYHWVDEKAAIVEFDGIRSNMPHALAPGAAVRAAMVVRTPSAPGRYILQIDLVEEHVTWFTRAGTPPFSCPVRVTKASRP